MKRLLASSFLALAGAATAASAADVEVIRHVRTRPIWYYAPIVDDAVHRTAVAAARREGALFSQLSSAPGLVRVATINPLATRNTGSLLDDSLPLRMDSRWPVNRIGIASAGRGVVDLPPDMVLRAPGFSRTFIDSGRHGGRTVRSVTTRRAVGIAARAAWGGGGTIRVSDIDLGRAFTGVYIIESTVPFGGPTPPGVPPEIPPPPPPTPEDPPPVVPLPPGAWLGAAGLGLCAGVTALRRRRASA
ncbi:MAG TPA: hypothetical protein VD971_13445 [Phycisphaerales bacterium]|nr:hypothetical protein [Phycisphaerales bacterium]